MRLEHKAKEITAIRTLGNDKPVIRVYKRPKDLKNTYITNWEITYYKIEMGKAYRITISDRDDGKFLPEGLALYKMGDAGRYIPFKKIDNSDDWYADFVAQGERIDLNKPSIQNRSGELKENLSYDMSIYELQAQSFKVYRGNDLVMDNYIAKKDLSDSTLSTDKMIMIDDFKVPLIAGQWYQAVLRVDKDNEALEDALLDIGGKEIEFYRFASTNELHATFLSDDSLKDGSIKLKSKANTLVLNGSLTLYKDMRSRSKGSD